jgi:hypothetical protein
MIQEGPNIAASIRQRLNNEARRRGDLPDRIMIRFAVERLLHRLSLSPYTHRFVLKGAMLFAVWSDQPHRPTRDVDLLGFGPSDAHEIEMVFRFLIGMKISQPDGLVFDEKSFSAATINEDAAYAGIRVKFRATLDGAVIPLQIDISYGHAVTPGPESVHFTNLLPEFPAPQIRAYPVYTVLAEKIHAIVVGGMRNSRMKDFYDVWFLRATPSLDINQLRTAVQQTFARRQTPVPTKEPVAAFSDQFVSEKRVEWERFISRNGLRDPEGSFQSVIARIREFSMPLFT